MKQYSKNRSITHGEFDPVRTWWENRKANGNAKAAHKDPKELLKEIQEKEKSYCWYSCRNPNDIVIIDV